MTYESIFVLHFLPFVSFTASCPAVATEVNILKSQKIVAVACRSPVMSNKEKIYKTVVYYCVINATTFT